MPTVTAINAFLQADANTKDSVFSKLKSSRAVSKSSKQKLLKLYSGLLKRWQDGQALSADEYLICGLISQHGEVITVNYAQARFFYEKSANKYSYILRREIHSQYEAEMQASVFASASAASTTDAIGSDASFKFLIDKAIKENSFNDAANCFKQAVTRKNFSGIFSLCNYFNMQYKIREVEIETLMTEVLPEMMTWLNLDINIGVGLEKLGNFQFLEDDLLEKRTPNRRRILSLIALLQDLSIFKNIINPESKLDYQIYEEANFGGVESKLKQFTYNPAANALVEQAHQNLAEKLSNKEILFRLSFRYSRWAGLAHEFQKIKNVSDIDPLSLYICCKVALHPDCDLDTLFEVILIFKKTLENNKIHTETHAVCKFYLHLVNTHELLMNERCIAESHGDIDFIILREAQQNAEPSVMALIKLCMLEKRIEVDLIEERIAETENEKKLARISANQAQRSAPVKSTASSTSSLKPFEDEETIDLIEERIAETENEKLIARTSANQAQRSAAAKSTASLSTSVCSSSFKLFKDEKTEKKEKHAAVAERSALEKVFDTLLEETPSDGTTSIGVKYYH